MTDHDHAHHDHAPPAPAAAADFASALMSMSAARRMAWAAGAVAALWLAVFWALSFQPAKLAALAALPGAAS
ncbi:MAG: hypothetical protein IPK81_11310 [Rhodospirillales bacterium]|nr:MAG: hypothetical protein IPK81_11310 [Rhodospirillales bacterium]